MRRLTPAQKYINDVLHTARMKKRDRDTLLAYLDTPEKQDAVVMWLTKHQSATPSEITAAIHEVEARDFFLNKNLSLAKKLSTRFTGSYEDIRVNISHIEIIKLLQANNIEEDNIVFILDRLDSQQKRDEFLGWLKKNRVTYEDILKKLGWDF